MIKFKCGGVANPGTDEYKDVIVKAAAPNSLKDILIGGGITLVGITYLAVTAFKNGAKAHDAAELQALMDLHLIRDGNKPQ